MGSDSEPEFKEHSFTAKIATLIANQDNAEKLAASRHQELMARMSTQDLILSEVKAQALRTNGRTTANEGEISSIKEKLIPIEKAVGKVKEFSNQGQGMYKLVAGLAFLISLGVAIKELLAK